MREKFHFVICSDPPRDGDLEALCGERIVNAVRVFVWEGNIRDRYLGELLEANPLRTCRKCIEAARAGRQGRYLAGIVRAQEQDAA